MPILDPVKKAIAQKARLYKKICRDSTDFLSRVNWDKGFMITFQKKHLKCFWIILR